MEWQMKNELAKLNSDLGHLLSAYREKHAELAALDREIMAKYKRKWHIERLLTKVYKAKPGESAKGKSEDLENMPIDVVVKKLELLPTERLEELLESVQARLHGTGE